MTKRTKKPTVYLETTVISYAVGRLSSNFENERKQKITRQWWKSTLPHFDAVLSTYVAEEIFEGDHRLSTARTKLTNSFRLLLGNDDIIDLADEYQRKAKIPDKARLDAFHIACATLYEIDYLVTWNCTHINNGFVRKIIETINGDKGLKTPIICTPEELTEAP